MTAMTRLQQHPKTRIYRLRQRVPEALKPQIGQRELLKSLGTKDLREAKRRLSLLSVYVEQLLDAAQKSEQSSWLWEAIQGFDGEWTTVAIEEHVEQARSLGDRDVDEIALLFWTWFDAGLEPSRLAGVEEDDQLLPDDIPGPIRNRSDLEDYLWRYLVLTESGVERKSVRLRRIADRAMEVLTFERNVQASYRTIFDVSEAVEASFPEAGQSLPEGELGLGELSDKYMAERQLPKKTEHEWRLAIRRFSELHGNMSVKAIQSSHVRDFKDAMLAVPARLPRRDRELPLPEILAKFDGVELPRLSAGTVKKFVGSLSTVLSWGRSNDYLDRNPAEGIRIAESRNSSETRLPYSKDDLQRILNGPVYRDGYRPGRTIGEAAYWIPLLGLFTGARLEEIASLDVEDIHRDGATWVIEFHDRAEDHSLKNTGSRRKVPVHPVLKDIGLLRYLDERRTEGNRKLFDIRLSARGRYGEAFSKWWGRYHRKAIGIADRRKVFHSLRHSFKDACREAGLEEAIHDALTGHSGGGAGRGYGSGHTVAFLADAIAKVDFHVDIGHLRYSKKG